MIYCFRIILYLVSKKSTKNYAHIVCPFLFSNLLYKMGNYFLDRRYLFGRVEFLQSCVKYRSPDFGILDSPGHQQIPFLCSMADNCLHSSFKSCILYHCNLISVKGGGVKLSMRHKVQIKCLEQQNNNAALMKQIPLF